jgi:hypothetical protein
VRRHLAFSILIASFALAPAAVQADAAADRKAELDRKKEEARKKAEERKKAAAAAAAANAAAGGSTAAGGTSSTTTTTTTTTTTSAGGTSSGGASAAAAGAGGAAKGGAGGAGGAATKTGTGGTTAKVEEKDAPLPTADIETLRKDRGERRKATVERLRRRWGSLLANQSGIDDLKKHARRVAFLQRVRAVAESKKDAKSVEAVDELLTREDERHASAMNALREGALPAGTKP